VGHAGRAGSLAVIKAYWLRLLAGAVLALSSAAVGPAWAQTITIPSGGNTNWWGRREILRPVDVKRAHLSAALALSQVSVV